MFSTFPPYNGIYIGENQRLPSPTQSDRQRDLEPNVEVYGEQKALKKGLATLREAEDIRTTTAAYGSVSSFTEVLRGVPGKCSKIPSSLTRVTRLALPDKAQ